MARPSKAVMAARAKSKALLAQDWQSSVPGVFFIAVGEPRWAARIRWQKDNAVYRDKTHVWKLSISPKTGGYTEKDLLHWQKQAEAWAEAEWLALDKSGKQFSRSAQASTWTLKALLTKYLEGLDDGSIKYRSAIDVALAPDRTYGARGGVSGRGSCIRIQYQVGGRPDPHHLLVHQRPLSRP